MTFHNSKIKLLQFSGTVQNKFVLSVLEAGSQTLDSPIKRQSTGIAAFPLEASGKSVPLLLGTLQPVTLTPFSIFSDNMTASSVLLLLTFLPPSITYQDPCGYLGSTQITRNNVSLWRPLVMSAQYPLTWLPYWETSIWTSLRTNWFTTTELFCVLKNDCLFFHP